jgi:hypothetical protein
LRLPKHRGLDKAETGSHSPEATRSGVGHDSGPGRTERQCASPLGNSARRSPARLLRDNASLTPGAIELT